MAGHNEIKVGSTEWVVRIAGEDVRVKVMDKARKANGRGYEFRLKRIGPDGRVVGRNIMRGSGALRKPGDPVKGFGGKAPAKKGTPPQRKAAAPKAATPKPAARKTPPARRNGAAPSPARPARDPLTSLRGRRTATTTPKATPAPRSTKKEAFQFRVPNDLVKKVMRKLEKLPKEADTYHIRNVVAGVLAEHERAKYFTPMRR
jgi:hypothetical protein